MIQAPGTFLRLGANAFQEEQDRSPALRTLLLRYALAFQAQVAQTAACNGRHTLDQRLARWLLNAHDRADGDEFPMTQEFLSMMLCVHRPGVTVAARLFQQAGLIRYGNGHITITDRAGLEAAGVRVPRRRRPRVRAATWSCEMNEGRQRTRLHLDHRIDHFLEAMPLLRNRCGIPPRPGGAGD